MNNFLAQLRRANAALATLLDRVVRALQVQRRAQTIAVASASMVVALMLLTAHAHARNARAAWGTKVHTVVATRMLEPGEQLNSDNTAIVDMPIGLVPDDAVTNIPAGATVHLALAPNTVITDSLISGGGKSVAVPDGWRVVAMAVDVTAPSLYPGDKVDVVSTDSVLASGALVVTAATETQGPSIAVPRDVAAMVATAAREGTASLVLAR